MPDKKSVVEIKNKDINISRIEVDRVLCIGAATCVVLADKTFELDPEGKAVIFDPPQNTVEEIIDEAKSCPVLAIKIYDKSGKLVYPS